MERKYICIEFIINSSRNTHAKRCPSCRKSYRKIYDRVWKSNKRLSDPDYSARMRVNWTRKKFFENPILFYKHRMFMAAKARALKEGIPFSIEEEDIVIPEKSMKVLKIYSRTCGPCKVLESNLQLAGIPHESIDVQSVQGEDIASKYEIRTVPTLILVDDEGNVVKRHSGLLGIQELKEFCNEAD